MNMAAIGFTISTIGTILIGVSAIMVHRTLASEHRIDRLVIRNIKIEQIIAIIGIFLIIIGYILELPSRN